MLVASSRSQFHARPPTSSLNGRFIATPSDHRLLRYRRRALLSHPILCYRGALPTDLPLSTPSRIQRPPTLTPPLLKNACKSGRLHAALLARFTKRR